MNVPRFNALMKTYEQYRDEVINKGEVLQTMPHEQSWEYGDKMFSFFYYPNGIISHERLSIRPSPYINISVKYNEYGQCERVIYFKALADYEKTTTLYVEYDCNGDIINSRITETRNPKHF